MKMNGQQQKVEIGRSIRSVDLYELSQRGMSYLRHSREKGILGLERLVQAEEVDLFRDALEMLIDGCSEEEAKRFLSVSREQTFRHLLVIYDLIEDLVSSISRSENCYLVAKRTKLYLRGDDADRAFNCQCDNRACTAAES